MTKARKLLLSGFISFLILGFVFIFIDLETLTWYSFIASLSLFVAMLSYDKFTGEEDRDNFIKSVNDYLKENEIKIGRSDFSTTNHRNITFSHDEEILYLFDNSPSFNVKAIDYKDILESELIQNGSTLTKTSRSSQVVGAAVGGALAGGIGSVVGALSANQKSMESVKSIDIRIITNDLNNPVLTFPIKDDREEFEKDSPIYKQIYNIAYEIHKTLDIVIKQQVKDN